MSALLGAAPAPADRPFTLWMASRSEHERSFEHLYRSHRAEVYRFLLRGLRNREEAEDATQTAFLQAYRSYLGGRRPERPRAWLFTIAENLRRRGYRERSRHLGVAFDETLVEARPPDVTTDEIREALASLPLDQRAAFVLREVAGLSYAEIAEQLRTSVGAVQMQLFRARRTLRRELAASSRRGLAAVPTWLADAFQSAERALPSLRVAGAALAAAAAAVAVGGATPSSPSSAPGLSRPRVVPPADLRADAEPPARPAVRRDRDPGQAARRQPAGLVPAPPTAAIVAPSATLATSPPAEPAPRVVLTVPDLTVSKPALPLEPAPLPELPSLPLPEPPPLPVEKVEGALGPQLDVLAGR